MDNEDLDLAYEVAESKYLLDLSKLQLKLEEDKMFIETDWDKVNAERQEQGLPKLSSDPKKKAYIEQSYQECHQGLIDLTYEYNKVRFKYDLLVANRTGGFNEVPKSV